MANENNNKEDFAFGKQNYILLIAGSVIVIIGFFLMMGGGSDDPAVFSEEIFNSRRLTIAPVTILLGYVVVIFAIMRKAKNKPE